MKFNSSLCAIHGRQLRLAESADYLSDTEENRTALARLLRSTAYAGTLDGTSGGVSGLTFASDGTLAASDTTA